MNLILLSLALAVSCSNGSTNIRDTNQAPSPETPPTSSTEGVKPDEGRTTSDQSTKSDESIKSNLDFVTDQFENYKYQVPRGFLQYSNHGHDDLFISSREYVLPKRFLPNSLDNGIYLTVGKVKCDSRDSYLELRRKNYSELGVPLTEGLVQGGKLNARSIAFYNHVNLILSVFDRDPIEGTCFVFFANVYGSGEWKQHTSVVSVLQNMAQTMSRD